MSPETIWLCGLVAGLALGVFLGLLLTADDELAAYLDAVRRDRRH